MRLILFCLLLSWAGCACSRDVAPPSVSEKKVTVVATAEPEEPSRAGSERGVPAEGPKAPDELKSLVQLGDDELSQLAAVRGADAVGAKMISRRTYSLKLDLGGGLSVAFKPYRRPQMSAYHEVAAYLLGRYLGIETLPVSAVCDFPMARLVALIRRHSPADAELFETKIEPAANRRVHGSCTVWLKGLREHRLENIGGFDKAVAWLNPAREVESMSPLAKATSDLLVFDYLIGNWDRFSGGNIFLNSAEDGFVLIDHNGTFKPWSGRQRQRMTGWLSKTGRVSASTKQLIDQLDEERVGRILAVDPSHASRPLLSSADIQLLLKRRDAISAHVRSLCEKHGSQNIIF